MARSLTDIELHEMLKSEDSKANNSALSYLHQQLFYKVLNFIHKNSGEKVDAEDIFQDGLFRIYKMAQQNKLSENIYFEAYLFTICKYLWWKKLKKVSKLNNLEDAHFVQEDVDDALRVIIAEEDKNRLLDVLKRTGEGCYKILTFFYYKQLKMKDIARIMNLKNEQVAKNKKSKCMKKLRDLIMQSENNFDLRNE